MAIALGCARCPIWVAGHMNSYRAGRTASARHKPAVVCACGRHRGPLGRLRPNRHSSRLTGYGRRVRNVVSESGRWGLTRFAMQMITPGDAEGRGPRQAQVSVDVHVALAGQRSDTAPPGGEPCAPAVQCPVSAYAVARWHSVCMCVSVCRTEGAAVCRSCDVPDPRGPRTAALGQDDRCALPGVASLSTGSPSNGILRHASGVLSLRGREASRSAG